MRTLRRLCAALVLTLVLALSAFAGEIDTMFVPPPPPPQQSMTQATEGEIDTGIAGEIDTTAAITSPVTDTALNLLQSVLSIF